MIWPNTIIVVEVMLIVAHTINAIFFLHFIIVSSNVTFENSKKNYTNEFVLHVNDGEQVARHIADKYQLKFERRVSSLLFFNTWF